MSQPISGDTLASGKHNLHKERKRDGEEGAAAGGGRVAAGVTVSAALQARAGASPAKIVYRAKTSTARLRTRGAVLWVENVLSARAALTTLKSTWTKAEYWFGVFVLILLFYFSPNIYILICCNTRLHL